MINKLASKNIVILGCGISGMISALKLASLGIPSTIIESADLSLVRLEDNRTTALTFFSKNFFIKINLWHKIENHCAAIEDIYVVDNKSPSMLHFTSPLGKDQAMGYLIQNQLLKKILLLATQNSSLIKIIDKCSYQKIKVSAELATIFLANNQQNINADLVIICDGKNSPAKNYYFATDFYKSYRQCALTFNVTHAKNHEGTAVEHFLATGPFAILPLLGSYSSSIVWTVDEQLAKQLLALEQPEFLYLVKKNFGSFLGEIAIASEVNSFPLTAYHAEQYFYRRLVLVADSAHVIHPLAGQGLNQGIKDIEALAENIVELGINDLALTKYEQQRKFDNQMMYLLTDNFNRIFSNHSQVLRKIRQIGFRAINALPLIKNNLVKYAMGKRST